MCGKHIVEYAFVEYTLEMNVHWIYTLSTGKEHFLLFLFDDCPGRGKTFGDDGYAFAFFQEEPMIGKRATFFSVKQPVCQFDAGIVVKNTYCASVKTGA